MFNKITIIGNTRTNDNVIRRELSFLEGDPFNRTKLNLSINSLKRLGYFKKVNYKIQVRSQSSGFVLNRTGHSSAGNTSSSQGEGTSSITLMEVAA